MCLKVTFFFCREYREGPSEDEKAVSRSGSIRKPLIGWKE